MEATDTRTVLAAGNAVSVAPNQQWPDAFHGTGVVHQLWPLFGDAVTTVVVALPDGRLFTADPSDVTLA